MAREINNILIRKAKIGDEKGIAEKTIEGLKRKNWLYTGINKINIKKSIKEIRISIKVKDIIINVAVDKKTGKIVGDIWGSFKKEGRLRHIVKCGWGLHPDYQGRGIGTMLLNEMIKTAKKKGFKRIEAEAAIENIPSWKMALKCGFKIEGTKKKALLTDDNRYIDTYILGRLL